uniref:Phosphotransferase n=1 Tax=Glossina brevipalpis TaxID=37001 RepID=A0A1A9WH79_9MUSC
MSITPVDAQKSRLDEILAPFEISKDELIKIKELIHKELKLGLSRDTYTTANTKCYPTYIQSCPSGCEHGMFLVTTLTSNKVYLLFFHLKGENEYRLEKQNFDIPENINHAAELFDFVVDKLHKLVKNLNLEREPLPVTLVIPFPLLQVNVSSAILLKMGKGMKIQGMENKDVGQLIKEALRRHPNNKFELVAVINDVTSAFMSAAWRNKGVKISFIIDEGCNAGYWEKVSNIETIRNVRKPEMLVNTDITEFGSSSQLDFLITEFDEALEKTASNKGQNIFEKFVSGTYISEIIRRVIIKCVRENIVFAGQMSTQLDTQGALKFANIQGTLIETDQFHYVQLMFDKLGINLPIDADCARIYQIMEKIVMRSASLVAAATVAMIEQINEPDVKVGLDGEVCNTLPLYHKMLKNKMDSILSPNYNYELVESNDDYGRGGAITASIILQENYIYENINTM